MKLSNVPEAYKKLTNRILEPNRMHKKIQNGTNPIISYPEFCLLVAENFTTDGYDIYTSDGRVHFSMYSWTCALLKTSFLFKSFIVNPITNALGIFILQIFHPFFITLHCFIIIFPVFYVWFSKVFHLVHYSFDLIGGLHKYLTWINIYNFFVTSSVILPHVYMQSHIEFLFIFIFNLYLD